MKILHFAILAALALPATASADQYYAGVFIGSEHVGNDNLNDVNPGLSFGHRWSKSGSPVEYHVEGGVFYNSYEEVSPILMAGVSTRLIEAGRGEFRVGASIGAAYYEELSQQLEDNYGIPNAGGFIPIVALTAAYRIDNTDIRLTTVPPDTDTKAVVNLSVAFGF